MMVLESRVESVTCDKVSKWAIDVGITLRAIKLQALGRRGYPDRLFIWEGGNLLFVEFKRPGESPRKLQKHIHYILNKMGFEVQVHDRTDDAVAAIKATIQASTRSATSHAVDGKERGE